MILGGGLLAASSKANNQDDTAATLAGYSTERLARDVQNRLLKFQRMTGVIVTATELVRREPSLMHLQWLAAAQIGRAVSLAVAERYKNILSEDQQQFRVLYAQWQREKDTPSSLFYAASAPIEPSLVTPDDQQRYRLTPEASMKLREKLRDYALENYAAALALAKTPDERAEVIHARAWARLLTFTAESLLAPPTPHPIANVGLSQTLILPKAISEGFREAAEVAPKNARYWQSLGDSEALHALFDSAQIEPKSRDAVNYYERALKENPKAKSIYFQLRYLQRSADQVLLLEQFTGHETSVEYWCYLAQAHLARGLKEQPDAFTEAKRCLERASTAPDTSPLRYLPDNQWHLGSWRCLHQAIELRTTLPAQLLGAATKLEDYTNFKHQDQTAGELVGLFLEASIRLFGLAEYRRVIEELSLYPTTHERRTTESAIFRVVTDSIRRNKFLRRLSGQKVDQVDKGFTAIIAAIPITGGVYRVDKLQRVRSESS
jgi:hypothetical protein